MLYDYKKRDFRVDETALGNEGGVKLSKITYPSFVDTHYEQSNRVVAYMYMPDDPRRDVDPVIFIHGMGTRNLVPLSWFPQHLALNGIPALLMILPFHFDRTPPGMTGGAKIMMEGLEGSMLDFSQCVIDARTCLDYLTSRGIAAKGTAGIMGVSFGGMIATITMGVDSRFRKGVFLVTGGNYFSITWHGLATRHLRKKYALDLAQGTDQCDERMCRKYHEHYQEYMDSLHTTSDLDTVPCARECFLFDPLTFAHFIQGRKVVMYNSIFDEAFPRTSSSALWKELGKPERHMLVADHPTVILYRKPILKRAVKLFTE